MKKSVLVTAINTLILASLTACGGGGGGGSDSPVTPTPTPTPTPDPTPSCDVYSDQQCSANTPSASTFTADSNATTLTITRTTDNDTSDADNNPDLIITSVYDINGVKTSETNQQKINGTLIQTNNQSFTYNTDNLLQELIYTGGKVTYTYNADNLLEKEETDGGNNGSIDKAITYTYENGKLKTESLDLNGNGAVDANDTTLTYFYENDKIIKIESSNPNSGIKTDYSYDCNGNLASKTYTKNSDGSVQSIDKFTYDTANNLVNFETEGVSSGVANKTEEKSYFCSNNVKSTTTGTSMEKRSYDSDNNLTKIEKSDDSGSTFKNVTDISYAGNPSIISKIKD